MNLPDCFVEIGCVTDCIIIRGRAYSEGCQHSENFMGCTVDGIFTHNLSTFAILVMQIAYCFLIGPKYPDLIAVVLELTTRVCCKFRMYFE